MNHKQTKLENPLRLEELKPMETLRKVGLQENHILCDIGAGSGIFTIPAAKLTRNKVYALETNDEMLSIISDKVKMAGLANIELVKVNGEHFDLTDHSIDIVLMVTVLHEIANTKVFLQEVKRIAKDNGKIVVIEYHKKETPMGPLIGHRIAKEDVIDKLQNIGFVVYDDFDLGENLNCLVFTQK